MDNLWILTEEKPKASVILSITDLYARDFDKKNKLTQKDILIKPIFEKNKFKFTYEVFGIDIENVNRIFLKTVSGTSSFVDFLVFLQKEEPIEGSIENMLMAIEETKTSDGDSRNTGVFQRSSKFIHIKNYSKDTKLYMLYNDDMDYDELKKPSDTNIFGTNMLLTMGVDIVGKKIDCWFKKYDNIDELIKFKNNMRKPPRGNVPIEIKKTKDRIEVSGRLAKPKDAGNIGHDPNIGALSAIAFTLRILGWDKEITITQHGVSQSYVDRNNARNKFLLICNQLDLNLEGINLNKSIIKPDKYWKYEMKSEKVASILMHILAEANDVVEVYQNHAGSERGFFRTDNNGLIALPKKDKNGINLFIPDLILYEKKSNHTLLIEGKQISTLDAGLREIEQYDSIEKEFIQFYFPNTKIERWITTFGGNEKKIPHKKVILHLNLDGTVFINKDAPVYVKNMFK